MKRLMPFLYLTLAAFAGVAPVYLAPPQASRHDRTSTKGGHSKMCR